MIWKNDTECARACRSLLRCHPKLAKLWTSEGPSMSVSKVLKQPYSTHERNQLRLALDVWNGSGHFDVSLALGGCDAENLRVIGEFFLALHDGSHRMMAEFILRGETVLGNRS